MRILKLLEKKNESALGASLLGSPDLLHEAAVKAYGVNSSDGITRDFSADGMRRGDGGRGPWVLTVGGDSRFVRSSGGLVLG